VSPTISSRVRSIIDGSPYVGYSYAYPHKLAYRPFAERYRLDELWSRESRDALFLYLHLPFCEFRCGFCNLFTLSQPDADLPDRYLDQLASQALTMRGILGDGQFARVAIGGGTPTYLDPQQLRRLFWIITEIMKVDVSDVPLSCEVSPQTTTPDRIEILKEFQLDRISIGVQSFDEQEARMMGRPQRPHEALEALELITTAGFPIVNVDLIYGGDHQTPESFLESVQTAMEFQPAEIYLYPLYVRPLTGLGKTQRSWDDHRLSCYRVAREELLSNGFEQVSLRMFRRVDTAVPEGPVYCCQQDGMVGLGCGARSYTRNVHYCSEYGVAQSSVAAILNAYLQQSQCDFEYATFGFELNEEERQRRYIIRSLRQANGLNLKEYAKHFEAFPEAISLNELMDAGLLERSAIIDGPVAYSLTELGMERSDAIGPWLYSNEVQQLMESAACQMS